MKRNKRPIADLYKSNNPRCMSGPRVALWSAATPLQLWIGRPCRPYVRPVSVRKRIYAVAQQGRTFISDDGVIALQSLRRTYKTIGLIHSSTVLQSF